MPHTHCAHMPPCMPACKPVGNLIGKCAQCAPLAGASPIRRFHACVHPSPILRLLMVRPACLVFEICKDSAGSEDWAGNPRPRSSALKGCPAFLVASHCEGTPFPASALNVQHCFCARPPIPCTSPCTHWKCYRKIANMSKRVSLNTGNDDGRSPPATLGDIRTLASLRGLDL